MTIQSSEQAAAVALAHSITSAFDGVALEDGISLSEARVIDDYGSDEERHEARRGDSEKSWLEVSDSKLTDLSDTFNFLCPKGLRFYLPAFMLSAVRHLHNEIAGLNGPLLYQLDFGPIAPPPSGPPERYTLLNEQQCKAVFLFLKHVAFFGDSSSVEDADYALRSYWNRYSKDRT